MNMKQMVLGIFIAMSMEAKEPWSYLYRHVLSKKEHTDYRKQKHFLYQKKGAMLFTQLILSWNAVRPKEGFFTFKIRVRDSETKKWDISHTAAIWGKEQKSFFSRGVFSSFQYCRLEMDNGRTADAFEIDVDAEGDGTIRDLKALFVVASNQNEFFSQDRQELQELPSCMVKKAVEKSQMILDHPRANGLCSPTSVSIVLQTLLPRLDIDPLITAQHVYDPALDIYGNWIFNVAQAFEVAQGRFFFYTTRLSSFKEVYEQLCKHVPVAVSIRGPIEGSYTPYKNGHILVIVGWDSIRKKVICCDPAAPDLEGVKKEYDAQDFLSAWERSRRLTYMPEAVGRVSSRG